jgi:hypothetical protein
VFQRTIPLSAEPVHRSAAEAPTTGRLAVFRGQTALTFRGDETSQIRDFFGTADQKPPPILDRPDELRRLAALSAILGFSSLALPLNAAQLRR